MYDLGKLFSVKRLKIIMADTLTKNCRASCWLVEDFVINRRKGSHLERL